MNKELAKIQAARREMSRLRNALKLRQDYVEGYALAYLEYRYGKISKRPIIAEPSPFDQGYIKGWNAVNKGIAERA